MVREAISEHIDRKRKDKAVFDGKRIKIGVHAAGSGPGRRE